MGVKSGEEKTVSRGGPVFIRIPVRSRRHDLITANRQRRDDVMMSSLIHHNPLLPFSQFVSTRHPIKCHFECAVPDGRRILEIVLANCSNISNYNRVEIAKLFRIAHRPSKSSVFVKAPIGWIIGGAQTLDQTELRSVSPLACNCV